MKTSESVFIHAKCSRTNKPFIIRFDEGADGKWCMTYGLVSIKPSQDTGSKKTVDFSRFRTGPQYKCPYCQNKAFFRCSCGSIGCYDGDSESCYCHACNRTIRITGRLSSVEGKGGNAQ